MEITMDEDAKKKNIDPKQSKNDSSKEDIPLWLQGFNDPEIDNSIEEDASNELKTNYWIDEIDHNEPFDEKISSEAKDDEPLDDALPKWISELSRVEGDGNLSSEDLTTHDNKDEAIPLKEPAEIDEEKYEGSELTEINSNDSPTQEGFIEISSIGLENSDDVEPSVSDLQANANEELPDWLQEMVSDPADQDLGDTSPVQIPEEYKSEIEQSSPKHSQNAQPGYTIAQDTDFHQAEISEIEDYFLDESADEIDGIREISDSDGSLKINDDLINEDEEILHQELMESGTIQDTDETPDSSFHEEIEHLDDEKPQLLGDEAFLLSSEEDTVPIDLSKTTLEPGKIKANSLRFLPQILLNARDKLSSDEVDQGLETIDIFIEENAYMEEISGWLEEITIRNNSTNHKFWETLGDLRLKNGEHQAAISAYAYATHLLIKMERETDESD